MTTRNKTLPGFVGYLWILLIFVSIVGPAIL